MTFIRKSFWTGPRFAFIATVAFANIAAAAGSDAAPTLTITPVPSGPALAPATPVPAGPRSPAQYWAETALDFSVLSRFFAAVDCSKTAHVQPCVLALHSIARFSKPSAQAVLRERVAAEPTRYPGVAREFGELRVLPYSADQERARNEGLSPAQAFARNREEVRADSTAAAAIGASGDASRIDWPAAIAYVLSLKQDDGAEAFVAGAALSAYYGALYDPHTHFSPHGQVEEQGRSERPSFPGVGLDIRPMPDGRVIVGPVEGGPAFAAGLFTNDELLAVDGRPIQGQSLDAVVGQIRGPVGTPVTLSIKRQGSAEPLSFTVRRQTIVVSPVRSRMITSATGQKTGYVRLDQFVGGACDLAADAIQTLERQGATGLVFDLRNNGGGLLTEGVCVGALFVGSNPIVMQRAIQIDETHSSAAAVASDDAELYLAAVDSRFPGIAFFITVNENGQLADRPQGMQTPHIAHFPVTQLPVVVMINGGSASASEIVAGALQDYAGDNNLPIWIAGSRSYGKGSVQTVEGRDFDLQGVGPVRGVNIARTTGRFYQPTGRTNQVVGILPDIPIASIPDPTLESEFFEREEDSFTNALPPVETPWTQPRPQQVATLQTCLGASPARQTFATQGQTLQQMPPDFGAISAGELLACIGRTGEGGIWPPAPAATPTPAQTAPPAAQGKKPLPAAPIGKPR